MFTAGFGLRAKGLVRKRCTFLPVCWATQSLTSAISLVPPINALGRTPYCCSTSVRKSGFSRSPADKQPGHSAYDLLKEGLQGFWQTELPVFNKTIWCRRWTQNKVSFWCYIAKCITSAAKKKCRWAATWTHVVPGRGELPCSGLCQVPWLRSAGLSGWCGAEGPAGCGTWEPWTAASEHAQNRLGDRRSRFSKISRYILGWWDTFRTKSYLMRAASAQQTRWWGPGRCWCQLHGWPERETGCSRSPRWRRPSWSEGWWRARHVPPLPPPPPLLSPTVMVKVTVTWVCWQFDQSEQNMQRPPDFRSGDAQASARRLKTRVKTNLADFKTVDTWAWQKLRRTPNTSRNAVRFILEGKKTQTQCLCAFPGTVEETVKTSLWGLTEAPDYAFSLIVFFTWTFKYIWFRIKVGKLIIF